MRSKKSKVLAAAFFCTCGWVYSGPANGEEVHQYQEGASTPIAPASVGILDALMPGSAGTAPAETPQAPATVPADAPQAITVDQPQAVTAEATPMPQFAPAVVPAAAPAAPAAPAAATTSAPAAATPVQMNHSLDLVSLNVQNTDLAQVLQLLSIQSRRNIVPSPKVSGTVTANLYDVTFAEALDAILQQNGAGYVERGNFIFIYTLEELKKIQDAERKVVSRVIKLDYMTAQDASTFVTPLLSAGGSIAISGAVGAGFQPTIGDGGANSYASDETLVIRDYPENLEEIARVIETLDTRPSQVLVEATVLQASINEDLAFGVDISILADFGLESLVGSPLGAVDEMITGGIQETPSGAIGSTVGNVANGDAGIKVGVLTNNVQVFVRALDRVTDTTVLANPKIMTLNRQRADVLVGAKIAYVSTTATATAATETVEFLETGTQLTVRPFVSSDGMIRMELKPSISNAVLRETATVTLPDEITQELTTNVMVRDGQTVVLGGLFKEETTIERNQVPGLGDIPYIGNAFKGRDDNVERSEVIFLVTPHIVRDKDIAAAGEAVMDGIEQIRIGTREKLLPWSRDKMVAGHLRDALAALEAGDRDKALWEVDLALGLDPAAVEARRMKEQLTGDRAYWPESSLLNDAIDLMVEQKTGQPVPVRSVPMEPNPAPSRLKPVPGGVSSALPDPAVEAAAEQARLEELEAKIDLEADEARAKQAMEELKAKTEPTPAPEAPGAAPVEAKDEPAHVRPVIDVQPVPAPAKSEAPAEAPATEPKPEAEAEAPAVMPAKAEADLVPADGPREEAPAPAPAPAPVPQDEDEEPQAAEQSEAKQQAESPTQEEVKEVDAETAKLIKDFAAKK